MARDGHFWADATINGVRRRMLIDSGATVTAISEATAAAARVEGNSGPVPVVLQTANGMAPARTGSVGELRLGNIVARDLKVVVSPAFGDMEVIGMNFLSKLASWRVEGRILILVPHRPQREVGRGKLASSGFIETDRPSVLAQAQPVRLAAEDSALRRADVIDVEVARLEDDHGGAFVLRHLAADVEEAVGPADVERQGPDAAPGGGQAEAEQAGAGVGPDLLGMRVVGGVGDEEFHGRGSR